MADTPNWGDSFPYIWTGGAGILGRLMFHGMMVQRSKRKPFSWILLWDLPIALGMGWAALGICVYIKGPFELAVSSAIISAYLGPYSVNRVFERLATKYFGPEEEEELDIDVEITKRRSRKK